jgi:predicted PurR-regulated permease PerM
LRGPHFSLHSSVLVREVHWLPVMAEPERTIVELRVPFLTLLKIALFLLLVLAVVQLVPIIILIIVATLLAVMFDPLVCWMEAHRVRRGLSVAFFGLLVFGALVAFIAFVIPSMAAQTKEMTTDLPKVLQQITSGLPAVKPLVDSVVTSVQRAPSSPQLHGWLTRGLLVGRYAIEGAMAVVLCIVLALYLLLEGRTLLAWLVSFVPLRHRHKTGETLDKSRDVMIAYMRGQVITCTVCGLYCYAVLMALHVPAALPLAVVAFIADLVPVVGTIAMTVPAVMLALTVSPARATIVVVAYLFYHLVESYWLIPLVYGRSMRLSTLTVLLAVTIGGSLQGVVGAVLVLPLVAVYPIIERIWLRERLADGTVEEHQAIESEDEERSKRATEKVLEG